MAKSFRTVFVDEITLGRLNKLSAITRIPKAVLIREGIDLTLDKYEGKLIRKRKKRGGTLSAGKRG
jgi:predicted DNA-binding protein